MRSGWATARRLQPRVTFGYTGAMPRAETSGGTTRPVDVKAILRNHGVKPTAQRIRIAQVLLPDFRHMTADEVQTAANAQGGSVSRATVYNTLNLFAKCGLVRQVVVDLSRVFYDSNTCDHHHFYIEDSGELVDVPAAKLKISGLPQPPRGTEPTGVDIVIRVRRRGASDPCSGKAAWY